MTKGYELVELTLEPNERIIEHNFVKFTKKELMELLFNCVIAKKHLNEKPNNNLELFSCIHKLESMLDIYETNKK